MKAKISPIRILIIISALILITSALGKLFGSGKLINTLTQFDLRLVEDGISNWKISPLIIRLFCGFELVLGALMLTKWLTKKMITFLLTILVSCYFIDFIAGWSNELTTQKTLLFLFDWRITLSVLPFLTTVVFINRINKEQKNNWWGLVFMPLFAVPFVLSPLFIEDYKSIPEQYEQKDEAWKIVNQEFKNQSIDLNKGEYLIAFFSTNCNHCNELAKVMGATHRGFNSETNLLLAFPGNKEDTEAFNQRNKSNFPFIRITKDEFLKVAGFSFPAIFKLKAGKVIKHWTGNSFSLSVRDEEF